jgi:hypothetical protein
LREDEESFHSFNDMKKHFQLKEEVKKGKKKPAGK